MPVPSACPAPAWLPVCRQHQHRPKDMAVGAGCLCWWKRRVTCGWGARGNPGKIWINCRLRPPCPPMQCSVVVSCLLRVSTCLVAWAAWSIDRLWPFLQEERKDDWPGLLIMMKWMKDSALQQNLSKICKTFCCEWAWNCLDLSGTISERRGVGCGKPGDSWWTFHLPVLIGEKETERKIYILHHNSTWQSI